MTQAQYDATCDRAVDLLRMVLLGDERPDADGHTASVEAAIRAYVRERAADPALTGTKVARALGWSLRRVQITLERTGGPHRDT
jgi:hypothetical protein